MKSLSFQPRFAPPSYRGPQADPPAAAQESRIPVLPFNRHFDVEGEIVFHHACKLGREGIVSMRLGSPYNSGRSRDWIKVKNPAAPTVKREAQEEWRLAPLM